MATTDHLEKDDNPTRITRDAASEFIKQQVVRTLGEPGDLLTVQVRPVGGERYRVNVVVGKNLASARVANSFFISADIDGNILISSPEIVRRY